MAAHGESVRIAAKLKGLDLEPVGFAAMTSSASEGAVLAPPGNDRAQTKRDAPETPNLGWFSGGASIAPPMRWEFLDLGKSDRHLA